MSDLDSILYVWNGWFFPVFSLIVLALYIRRPKSFSSMSGAVMTIPSEPYSWPKKEVVIDGEARVITVITHGLFSQRKKVYSADAFHSVVSYLHTAPGASWAYTRVELATASRMSGLFLARFDAAWPPLKDFLATYLEAPEANSLRIEVAKLLNLTDGGYLGDRFELNQVEPIAT